VVVDLDRRSSQFCPIHREVRAAEESHRISRIGGRERDTDAGADAYRHRAQGEGLLEFRHEAPSDGRGVLLVGVQEDDAELIAAKPDQHVVAAQTAREPGPDLLQKFVPGRMAE
jgi:hypothetical protein